MKEQIIAILINHVHELAGHSWIMGIPKNDVDIVAEEIDALFAEAMPTEEEIEKVFPIALDNIEKMVLGGMTEKRNKQELLRHRDINRFRRQGIEWFRNRMGGGEK